MRLVRLRGACAAAVAAHALLLFGSLRAETADQGSVALLQASSAMVHASRATVDLSPTHANSLIVVALMFTTPDPSPLTITDNAPGGSNTYKSAVNVAGPNSQYLCYVEGAKADVTRITVTAAYSVIDVIVAEYSGVAASGALDRVSAFNNEYSADSVWRTGRTQPTRRAPELAVVAGGGTYFSTDFTHRAGVGYHFVTTHWASGRFVSGLMMEDRVLTTMGSYEATGYTQMAGAAKDIRYGMIATFYLESPASVSHTGAGREQE